MFYRRNLPHWQPEGAYYFITFRLAGSLPKKAIAKLRQEQRTLLSLAKDSSRSTDRLSVLRERIHKNIFNKYDQLLDGNKLGPTWLSNPKVAEELKKPCIIVMVKNTIYMPIVLCQIIYIWFVNCLNLIA